MKVALLYLSLVLLQIGGVNRLNRIAATNELKRAAEQAYAEKRYEDAAALYERLVVQWNENSDAVLLNRAHALLQANKTEEATEAYRQLTEGGASKTTKSTALQQLGFLASAQEELQNALQYYKEALKANPANETARYNYELAWNRLNEQEQDPEKQKDEQEPEEQPKIEPSEWAKQQKAKADALNQQFRYGDALELMQQSLKKDSTVAAYNDYIRRLSDIAEIDQ